MVHMAETDPNPFMRDKILDRTGGDPVCVECLSDTDKLLLFREGYWKEQCPTCKRETMWQAIMPGEGSWNLKGEYEKP